MLTAVPGAETRKTNLFCHASKLTASRPVTFLCVGRNRYWTLVHHNPVLEPKFASSMDVETLRPTSKVLLSSSPGSPPSFAAQLPWFQPQRGCAIPNRTG